MKQLSRLVIAALFLTAPSRASAQRLSGIVRDSSAGTPIAGAVVSALDSLRQPLGRALSDGSGRYSMALPDNAFELRVVRLGYQPRTIAVPRRRGALLTIDIAMRSAPTLLSTVVVKDRRLCEGEHAGALSLWEQARAGLLTSIVAREALPAQTTIMGYQRAIATGNHRVTQQTEHLMSTKTSRPFLAADEPRVLAERGYVEDTPQALRFKAPDADVLLDDSFEETHCFSVRTADAEHAGAIGLAFDPIRGRDTLVDVSGTLWIESGVPALRSLEFTWVDRQGALKRGGAGGELHFHTMPNGVSFIEIWALRLPIVDATRTTREGRLSFRAPGSIRQTNETGGVVLSAEWPDGATWHTSLKPLSGLVTERETSVPIPGVLVGLEANGEAYVTDSTGRFTIFPVLPGKYMVQAIDTVFSGFAAPRSDSHEVDIAPGDSLTVEIQLPGRVATILSRCGNKNFSRATASILLGRLVDSAGAQELPRDVRVSVQWNGDSTAADPEVRAAKLDESGRFAVCGVPRGREILLAVTHNNAPFMETPLVIAATRPVASLRWTLDFAALASAVGPKPTGLHGHVTQLGRDVPLAGVDVWLPALDRRVTTDSAGTFTFENVPTGRTYVQLRRIGYAVQRDTVTLAEGRDLIRDFALASQAAMLDTNRTVASGTKYRSHLLQGFEERRGGALGSFISDSTLRANDDLGALSQIITSRLGGVTLRSGTYGQYVASTRGTGCLVTTYLDGMLMYSSSRGNKAPPVDVSRFNISDLAGVEYYASAATAPPQFYAQGVDCGILLLWTRER